MNTQIQTGSVQPVVRRDPADWAIPAAGSAQRWALAGAWLLTAYYFLTSIYISLHRQFWFDEVLTTRTVRLQNWQAIWDSLKVGDSPNPIGFFAVARLFDQWFGPSEIGIRLPATLGVIAGMWLTYHATRRVTDRLHGLLAMAVLTCSFLPYYAYEGRSYGLHFLLAAFALWVWTARRSPFLLAGAFFLGVLVHYYMVLCMLPLLAEEAYHWRPWRRPSFHIVAATLGAAGGLIGILPLVLISKRGWSGDFWAAPSGLQVPSLYTGIFPAGLFLVSLTALWVILNRGPENLPAHPVTSAERTGWFALLIPVAGYILGKLVTHALVDRYLIGMLPGVALAFACLCYRRWAPTPRIYAGVLLLFAGHGIYTQSLTVRHPEKIEACGQTEGRTRAMVAMEERLWAAGAHHIVITYPDCLYQTARYYSQHPERYVWWTNPGKQPRNFVHYPVQYWTLDDVKQHSRDAVFVDINTAKLETLQATGARTTVHTADGLSLTRAE